MFHILTLASAVSNFFLLPFPMFPVNHELDHQVRVQSVLGRIHHTGGFGTFITRIGGSIPLHFQAVHQHVAFWFQSVDDHGLDPSFH